MNKIIYLIILGAGIMGCTSDTESLQMSDDPLELNAVYEIEGYQTTSLEFSNLSGKVQGYLYVTNDCENLYLKLQSATEEDLDDAQVGIFEEEADFPVLGNNGKLSPGQLGYDKDDADELLWIFPLSEISTSGVFIFSHSWGDWAGELNYGNSRYFHYEFQICRDDLVCTYGKGFWRNHSNDNPEGQEDLWPISTIMLGSTQYPQDDLNSILDAPYDQGNGLVNFAQHLIAAKLNVAHGAESPNIEETISEADALIGDLIVLVGAFSEEQKKEAKELKELLETFNESNPCEEELE